MKAFVTGGTGFIGSYLVKRLVDMGYNVLCLRRKTSNLEKLDGYDSKVEWVNVDEDWKKCFMDFAPFIVYNLAWNGVSASDRILWDKQVCNIDMQQELLDVSLTAGVKKIVGVGSQSEYGNFENKIDESYPLNPKTAYAAAKVAALTIMKAFCEINNIAWYWFRVFPIFGPHESENWLIPKLIKSICTNTYMDLTPGEQKLAYLYVGECANAIASPISVDGHCGIYNICADNPMPLKKIVEMIRNQIDPSFKLNFGALPYRYGQSMYMEGDTSSLRENLYPLRTDTYEQKMKETIQYYVNKYK
jgi:nucleoside-diphosphate-sugar epimerase